MTIQVDIVIVGAGIAGLTAAISAQNAGLRTIVLERRGVPGDSPGESLHPGIAAVVEKLGVLEEFEYVATGRFPGIIVHKPKQVGVFEIFGGDQGESWRGYHVPRMQLSALLARRAVEQGSEIESRVKSTGIEPTKHGALCVKTQAGPLSANWVLDATGTYGFTTRRDGTGLIRASRPKRVTYYYTSTEMDTDTRTPLPHLRLRSTGWTWEAQLGDGTTAHVELETEIGNKKLIPPEAAARARHADGSWVVARRPASNRIFRIGDAAMRFDPSSGKGVLRAMMTSMMAVHLISGVDRGRIRVGEASAHYNGWIHKWFRHDLEVMRNQFGS